MIENFDDNVPNFKVVLILSQMAFAYSRSSGWFDCHTVGDALAALGKNLERWDTYLFVDCCDLQVVPCRTISVSSPNQKHFECFIKAGCERRYLPAWTLEDLKRAFVELSKFGVFDYPEGDWRRVTEDSISTEFEVWGGIPRMLYHKSRFKYSPYLLMQAMRSLKQETIDRISIRFSHHDTACSKETRRPGEEHPLTEEELPHLLYHYKVDAETFDLACYAPVNETIA